MANTFPKQKDATIIHIKTRFVKKKIDTE